MKKACAHAEELASGSRFEFGANWRAFLATLDQERIEAAKKSLCSMLQCENLIGKTFLDIGSGSGLFSLAARELGAKVHSFDFDPLSVACTRELKNRYYPDDDNWTIQEGSVLDPDFLNSLGQFDIVYAWGVLHHTGAMWKAIEMASELVQDGGYYFISIYNDQGGASRRWLRVKQTYNRMPHILRPVLVFLIAFVFEVKHAMAQLLRGGNPLPFNSWRKKKERGMSVWHDWVDWCGGLPFEFAKPEQIIVPLVKRGFVLENLTTCGGGWGCNQYVFRRWSPKHQ